MLRADARRAVFRDIYAALIGEGMPGVRIATELGIDLKAVYEDVHVLGLRLPVHKPGPAAIAAATRARRERAAQRRVTVQAELAEATGTAATAQAQAHRCCAVCKAAKLTRAFADGDRVCHTCRAARDAWLAEPRWPKPWKEKGNGPRSPEESAAAVAGEQARLAQAAALGVRVYRMNGHQPPPVTRWCCGTTPGSAHEGSCPVRSR